MNPACSNIATDNLLRKKQTPNNKAILKTQDMNENQENYNEIVIFRLCFRHYQTVSLSDDVFEIKRKYHNFMVILLILTHILSYQDGFIVRSLFLPLFAKVVGWFLILITY